MLHDSRSSDPVPSILLIDDDIKLGGLMSDYFSEHQYHLDVVSDGRDGLARVLLSQHDLVILDVMLPTLDGFEVLRQLRRRSRVPVIMLTARATQDDRITGLETGADDYLLKPFEPRELLARVRAVLRRTGQQRQLAPVTIEVGDVRLNPATREIWRGEELLQLTSIEFDILDLLMRSAGRIVSRNEIAAALYQRESTPYERTVDVHISHLRKKLEPARLLIKTVRSVGYLLSSAR
jgi:two-component system response regulator CpxR